MPARGTYTVKIEVDSWISALAPNIQPVLNDLQSFLYSCPPTAASMLAYSSEMATLLGLLNTGTWTCAIAQTASTTRVASASSSSREDFIQVRNK